MPKNKSIMEDLIIPDESLDESVPEQAVEEHPKKAARKAPASPKTQAKSGAKRGKVSKDASPKKNKPKANSVPLQSDIPFCQICGRALSKPSSVDQGMGDVCAGRHKRLEALGVSSMQEHRENNTVLELPKDYMKLKDAIAEVRRTKKNHGISGTRVLQGVGGNGLLLPPVNEHFRVVFYKGTRYIPASCLNHLEDLKKV